MKRSGKVQPMGRYIVADPKICHGKPTFRGTRVLVADVLEQVAAGMAWDSIIDEWNGSISKEAIREAVPLAKRLGAVIRISSAGLSVWRAHAKEISVEWDKPV